MLAERVRAGLGDSVGCVKEGGWGFLEVDFCIGFGLSKGFGYTPFLRAGASVFFVDG